MITSSFVLLIVFWGNVWQSWLIAKTYLLNLKHIENQALFLLSVVNFWCCKVLKHLLCMPKMVTCFEGQQSLKQEVRPIWKNISYPVAVGYVYLITMSLLIAYKYLCAGSDLFNLKEVTLDCSWLTILSKIPPVRRLCGSYLWGPEGVKHVSGGFGPWSENLRILWPLLYHWPKTLLTNFQLLALTSNWNISYLLLKSLVYCSLLCAS